MKKVIIKKIQHNYAREDHFTCEVLLADKESGEILAKVPFIEKDMDLIGYFLKDESSADKKKFFAFIINEIVSKSNLRITEIIISPSNTEELFEARVAFSSGDNILNYSDFVLNPIYGLCLYLVLDVPLYFSK